MKKLLLVAAFLVGMSSISFAQGGQRGGGTPEQRLETLKTQVTGITDDQATKIKAVYAGQAKVMDSLRTVMQNGGDRATMMPAFTKMNDATNVKIKAILTADQQAAYQKVIDARAAAMKQAQGGN